MEQSKFDILFTSEPIPLQEPNELKWLIKKVEKLSPLKTIVEIGIDKGGTLKFWDELISEDGLIVGIDINNALESYKPKHRFETIFQDSTLTSTIDKLKIILGESSIDFLHIDGCHEGKVLEDYANFSPFVRKGGLIALHDCGEPIKSYHPTATSMRWFRGGAPDVVKCFLQVKLEKEVLQYDQGTGVIYV
jgi:hypothetical protein